MYPLTIENMTSKEQWVWLLTGLVATVFNQVRSGKPLLNALTLTKTYDPPIGSFVRLRTETFNSIVLIFPKVLFYLLSKTI